MHLLHILLLGALALTQDEYRDRRARLRAALPDAAILLSGTPDRPSDPRIPMLQEPNFLYLSGWSEPGAVLLILPQSESPNEVLYLPPRNPRKERYDGPRAAPGDEGLLKTTGFSTVLSTDIWESDARLRIGSSKLHTLKGHNPLTGLDPREATDAIARLRMVKSASELASIQRSIDVTLEAHQAAWKRLRAGLFEYQIAAAMSSVVLDHGCERFAYKPTVGSGPNAVILHYGANHRRIDRGELLLIDAAAECASYAADVTRTLPVSGKFTARQRELYDIVLGAEKAAIAAVKPGESIGPAGAIHRAAKDYMDQHGRSLSGEPLGKYFTHGISHHVGLEVHDAMVHSEPLAAGMVITIEPGLYIPEENTGIRVEDMVLVTATGAKVLSSSLPRDAVEIEKRLAR